MLEANQHGPFHSLAVFCGSQKGSNANHQKMACGLGRAMAKRGLRLIYGGGGIGLMGVLAEVVLAEGGEVVGVIPDFLMKYEVGDPGVTELIIVDSMHDRKRQMFELADGFVILSGGLGTIDEMIEIITWKQLQLHRKPIVVLNVDGYWDVLDQLIQATINGGFAHPAIRDLFTVAKDIDEMFKQLADAPPVIPPKISGLQK